MKKVLLSGATPSGVLTLGNYLGAIKSWVEMLNYYDSIYMVADLHAITVRQDADKLHDRTIRFVAQYIAAGLDPAKCTIFLQSHNKDHANLGWVLDCFTQIGELSRMTQFKDKSKKSEANLNAGLFTYPSLMAADILIYDADIVPIGEDQRQHLEITKVIANRFNNIYGETFKIPEGFTPKTAARIMSLQDPAKKMSKSDTNLNNIITLLDEDADIIKKINKSVTDSDAKVEYKEGKSGINNLLNIYCACKNVAMKDAVKTFETANYGTFKKAVAEAVISVIAPIRENFKKIYADRAYIDKVLKEGKEKAEARSKVVLERVYEKVGFVK